MRCAIRNTGTLRWTVGSQEVKLTARIVGTLWERKGEEGEAVKEM